MSLLDLSKVTKSLVEVIRQGVSVLPDWQVANGSAKPTVLPVPPDGVSGAICFYLYHVEEEEHTKNLIPRSPGLVPVRQMPMGLSLYYQLTAHPESDTPDSHYEQQRLFGFAMRALHDFPLIDEKTAINSGTPNATIFSDAGLNEPDNKFRVVLEPLRAKDSVHYWTAGTSAMHLAAYYQVSVVLLEPQEFPIPTRRVAKTQIETFVRGKPHLVESHSLLHYTVPGENAATTVEVSPAEVSVGQTATFTGSGLKGDEVALRIRGRSWPQPEALQAVSWRKGPEREELRVTLDATIGARVVVPGLYGARVVTTELRTTPDGRIRKFPLVSNELPFVVAPGAKLTGPSGGIIFTVDGGRFSHSSDIAADAVEVHVGEFQLQLAAGPNPGPGEYLIDSPTQLQFAAPVALASGEPTMFRILVNGVESAPQWITP